MDEDNRNFVEKIIKNLFIGINKVVHSYSPEEVLKSAKNRVNVILCKIKKGKPLNAEEVADKLKKDKELRFYATYGDMNYFLDCLSEPLNDYFNPENGIEITDEDLDDTKRVIASLKEKWLKEAYKNETKNKKINLFLIKKHDDHDVQKLTENFAYSARGQFTVFLSAITNKSGSSDKTLEYEVAKRLKDKLKCKGCNVFWWEDDINYDNENLNDVWSISTKISIGLAFSSLFIGLSFDSVSENNGTYTYNCMYTEGDNAYKIPNYFKYEVEKFDILRSNKNKIKKFVKPLIHKQKDFVKYVPYGKDKILKFYTLGDPESFENEYEIFNNKGYLNSIVNEEICRVYKDSTKTTDKKAEAIADIIFNNLSDGGYLDNLINKQNELIEESPVSVPTSVSAPSEEPDCFKPFAGDELYLHEDSTSVPSDYLFKYAILDSKGNNAKKHFTIFPEKTMGKNGWVWSLKLLIKDWNYSKTFGSTDNLKLPESSYILLNYNTKEKNNKDNKNIAPIPLYDNTNGIDNADGNGVIPLIKGVDNSSFGHISGGIYAEKDNPGSLLYSFEIVFIPKRVIHYKSRGNKFVFSDIGGISKKGFKFDVCSSNTNIKKEKLSKCVRIEGNTDNYVLIPKGTTADYYVMVKDRKAGKDRPIKNRKMRCPYCGRYIGNKLDECSPGDKCTRNFIYNYSGGSRHNFYINGDVDEEKLKNNTLKPEDSCCIQREGFAKSAVVSFLGATQSGKSTFISSLFGSRTGSDKTNEQTVGDPNCQFVKGALKSYVKDIKCCETNVPKGNAPKGKRNISALNLKDNYSQLLYKDFIPITVNKKEKLISHIPFTMELSNIQGKHNSKACLSFYDAPGGYIYSAENNDTDSESDTDSENRSNIITYEFPFLNDEKFILDSTMAFRSDCLVVLLNGKEEDSNGTGVKKDKNVFTAATQLLDKLRQIYDDEKQKNANIDRSKVALAVVICKFDIFASDFAENIFLRTTPPFVKGRNLRFEDSPIHNYINNCSDELVDYIKGMGHESLVDAVQNFTDHTDHYKFFAVSSIGRNDSVKDKKKLYFTEPSNIENVLLWIMYKTGIIR